MLRRYSKARTVANNATNGEAPNSSKPPAATPTAEAYEKQLQDLYNSIEESQKHIDQVCDSTHFFIVVYILLQV